MPGAGGLSGTWVITGANRGIGLELARTLVARGANVIGTARRPEEAHELCDAGARVEALDVANDESVRAFATRLQGAPVDALINNAGIGERTIEGARGGPSFERMEAAELLSFLDVNTVGVFRVTRALLENLRAGEVGGVGGRRLIVNMSSELGSIAGNTGGGWPNYRVSKAALNMLSREMAAQLGSEGFISVAIHPGWVRTRMGGGEAPMEVGACAESLVALFDRLTPADSGAFLRWDGSEMAW